jgi:molybdate-binding protein
MVNVIFGAETAARRFDLDFIPAIREQYFFACELQALAEPQMPAVLDSRASDEFKLTVSGLAGDDGALCGSVLKLNGTLQRFGEPGAPSQ